MLHLWDLTWGCNCVTSIGWEWLTLHGSTVDVLIVYEWAGDNTEPTCLSLLRVGDVFKEGATLPFGTLDVEPLTCIISYLVSEALTQQHLNSKGTHLILSSISNPLSLTLLTTFIHLRSTTTYNSWLRESHFLGWAYNIYRQWWWYLISTLIHDQGQRLSVSGDGVLSLLHYQLVYTPVN